MLKPEDAHSAASTLQPTPQATPWSIKESLAQSSAEQPVSSVPPSLTATSMEKSAARCMRNHNRKEPSESQPASLPARSAPTPEDAQSTPSMLQQTQQATPCLSNEQLAKSSAEQPISTVPSDQSTARSEEFNKDHAHTAFGDVVGDEHACFESVQAPSLIVPSDETPL